jgi:DNA polymerase-3 subunit alpha
MSLFGETSNVQLDEPTIPQCEDWHIMEKLSKEKEAIGMYISGHPLDDYKTEIKYFCNGTVGVLHNLENLIGRDVSVAGIVTDVQHRVSAKSGKGWAMFTIEDFEDSYQFRIFGEDYLKFRHFLIMNQFLHIKIKVQKGWNDGNPRINFISMQMLQDVLEKYAKKLTLQMDIKELSEEKIQEMQELIEAFKGKHILNIVVYDLENKIKLHMQSRSKKIGINKDLLDKLEKEQWFYRLN